MANYSAKIDVILSGLRELSLLEDRLEKIGGIINTLNKTPVALNVGGRGKERDLSGKLSKEVNDYVREWVNGNKEIGKSINAVQQQAAAFNELLRETAMIQKDKDSRLAVGYLATAWADTTRAARQYEKTLNDIQRKALGLQPQAIRDLEVARREAFVRSGGKTARREKAAFLAGESVSQFPIGPNPRSTRRRFEGDTSVERAESALVAKERQAQRALNIKFFAEEKAQVLELDRLRAASAQKQTQQIQAIGKTVKGSLSSAAIGGAFPLLFGQSPQAAVGGAIGGLLGGTGGGFAGSLIGTALGELEAAKARTKELALELGLTSTQAKVLASAFELAGRNSQQLEAAITNIQGLGLSTKETASAIKIAVELAKEYGGSVEKIAQSFADTLESGKVSIATLNKFTAQGIPIQEELAAKFGVSRTKLLEMAKDGQISVQNVTDALVKMGRQAENTASRGETGFDRFTRAVTGISTAIASAAGALIKILIPALDAVLSKLSAVINRATVAINLITDAQVGEASAALFRSGTTRGLAGGLFANKGNIDDLTQGLKSLQPLTAKTKEQFDRIAAVAQRYRVELQQYGGALGEYAVGTAQVELTRVQTDLARAAKTVGAPTPAAGITGITAPANLPPSDGGGGKSAADKAAEDAAREAARVAEIIRDRQLATLELQRQAVFSQKIAEAEMGKDAILVRELQGQQELMQLGIQTAAELEKEKNSMAQLAIAREFQAKKALTLLGIEIDIAKIKKEQTDQYNTIISDLDTELALKYAITEQERTQLRIAAEMRKLRLSDPYLTEPQLMQIQEAKERLAAPKTGAELIQERTGALEDELKSLTDVGNIAITVADGIGSAFSTSFKGIIDGSMTAREALASFFTSVADMFLDMAAQIIAKMITMAILNAVLGVLPGAGGGLASGFSAGTASAIPTDAGGWAQSFATVLPGRATGGPVSGGQMYMVGERGPELFVPGRSGTIVPNDKMGSGGDVNVIVNVDAKGTSVEGDESEGRQLGRLISAAVQSELIKQQRPGGLLAR